MGLIVKTASEVAADREAADRAAARAEASAYLASTDWLVVRQAETKKRVPQDVLERRAAARAVLNT